MVYSNIYGTDNISFLTKSQSARAASLIHHILAFRRKILRQELKPILVQDLVPLCSWQYERMFNTTRIPGIEGDKLVHFDDSSHIVVMHKGCYYKMTIYNNGRLLKPLELKHQLDQILNFSDKCEHSEQYLASLTAWDRAKWAETRDKFFSKGVNRASLECIERAAITFNLHDGLYDMDLDNDEKMKVYSQQCLYGKIYDIWFDKSFHLACGTNGVVRIVKLN
jgi:carnitine O-palmitoyltransferase 1, liver isoform